MFLNADAVVWREEEEVGCGVAVEVDGLSYEFEFSLRLCGLYLQRGDFGCADAVLFWRARGG